MPATILLLSFISSEHKEVSISIRQIDDEYFEFKITNFKDTDISINYADFNNLDPDKNPITLNNYKLENNILDNSNKKPFLLTTYFGKEKKIFYKIITPGSTLIDTIKIQYKPIYREFYILDNCKEYNLQMRLMNQNDSISSNNVKFYASPVTEEDIRKNMEGGVNDDPLFLR